MFEEFIISFFHDYAYQPHFVYLGVVLMMLASSFGLPVPEELTLVSSGFLAYIGLNPHLYPPPSPDAAVVNVHILAVVSYFAVTGSDFLVYGIGRVFGTRALDSRFVKSMLNEKRRRRIEVLTSKYGLWAVAIFRFTPGVRFPGHIACGTLKIPIHKFLMVDGFAALISVPTQIYLVGFYGKQILETFEEVKLIIFGGAGVFLIYWLVRKVISSKRKGEKCPEQQI